MMKVAEYLRVSVVDGRSIDRQASELAPVAKGNGWSVTTYAEPGSASRYATHDRAEWTALRGATRDGRFDLVALYEPSRGGRELGGWIEWLNDCRETGTLIYVHIDERTYDVRKWSDYRALAEAGIASAGESELNSVRVKSGHARAAGRGRPFGRTRYGFTRRYIPNPPGAEYKFTIVQEADPLTAPVVTEVIGRVAANVPVSAIVEDLFNRGIPSPTGAAKWPRDTVRYLVLHGEAYIGKRRVKGGPLIDGDWPAIAGEAEYWRAVNVLRDPARKGQLRGGQSVRPGAAKWLLSHSASCGACGWPLEVVPALLTYAWAGAGTRSLWDPDGQLVARAMAPWYRCSRHRAGCVRAPVAWGDFIVLSGIAFRLSSPEAWAELNRDDGAALAAAEDELAAERLRLAAVEAELVAGASAVLARAARAIEGKISALDEKAALLRTPTPLRAAGGTLRAFDEILSYLTSLELGARRAVVRQACPELKLNPPDGEIDDPHRWVTSRA